MSKNKQLVRQYGRCSVTITFLGSNPQIMDNIKDILSSQYEDRVLNAPRFSLDAVMTRRGSANPWAWVDKTKNPEKTKKLLTSLCQRYTIILRNIPILNLDNRIDDPVDFNANPIQVVASKKFTGGNT